MGFNNVLMSLLEMEEKLRGKVQAEYTAWFEHVRPERERKRDIMKKVLDTTLPEGQVRVNLLWRNIQLELALFLTDEIGVSFLSSEGITGEEIMKNANLVAKYDDVDMDLRYMRETIVNHNALYWLSATVTDNYDDDEQQPISDVIDPLALIIDPFNYNGSKCRFIGVERRLSRSFLETSPWYEGVKDVSFSRSIELDLNKQDSDYANNLRTIVTDNDLIDVYDHYTTYEGKKILTTWANDRTILLRYVEIEPLSNAEKKKPSKVKFPIQLHRRKPKLGSVFGVSIADEVLQFQDAVSILTNLSLIQANNIGLWPDVYADERLGIDTETMAQRKPGGRIIPIENDSGMPVQNLIYSQTLPAPSPFIDGMIRSLKLEGENTTNISQQAFGVSQSWTQTKAEIQTLQQNASQILIWISNNYMQGQKEFWACHYRAYCLYMPEGKMKHISLYQKGSNISLSLSRDEFVSDGKVNVYITSKSQETLENDKEFNKLLAIANLYLPNMKKGYSMNDFLRILGRKSNIRDFDEYRYIAPSVDEWNAMKNLPLLNKNQQVPWPKDGEDYLTYLLIYRQALPTQAKFDAIQKYEEAYTSLQKPMDELLPPESKNGVGNQQTGNTALNNLNQNSQSVSALPTM